MTMNNSIQIQNQGWIACSNQLASLGGASTAAWYDNVAMCGVVRSSPPPPPPPMTHYAVGTTAKPAPSKLLLCPVGTA